MDRIAIAALVGCFLMACSDAKDPGGAIGQLPDSAPPTLDSRSSLDTQAGDVSDEGAAPDTFQGGLDTTPLVDTALANDTSVPSPEDTQLPPEDTQLPPEDTQLPPEDTQLPPEDTQLPPEDTSPPPLEPCSPALAINPTENVVSPYGMVLLGASGGTGQYLFEIDNAESILSFNVLTGALIAGPTVGVINTVTLHDAGCVGTASSQVETVEMFSVAPAAVSLAPQGCFQLQTSGGSGSVSYEFQKQDTASSLTADGYYTAGDTGGVDVIRVTDTLSNEYALTVVSVEVGAGVSSTARQIVLPLGSRVQSPFVGGSGLYTFDVVGDSVTLEGNSLLASKPGLTILTATDSVTGCTADQLASESPPVRVYVTNSLTVPTVRSFTNGSGASVLSAGDLNGDDFSDALFAVSRDHYQGLASGAVFVYAGNAMGLDDDPVQVLSTKQRGSRFGNAMALGDFNGDDQADLAVGAPAGGATPAHVHLFYGEEAGFFEALPTKKLVGPGGWGNSFGRGVTACDFNQDGFDDLAVGAPGLHDQSKEVATPWQGGFYVYLGRPEGLSDTPQQIRFGEAIDLEGNPIAKDLELGQILASGDINGDGACDLAVTASGFPIPSSSKTTALFVYKGIPASEASPGGLSLLPVKGYASIDGLDAEMKHFVVSDLDGNGAAEIVLTVPYAGQSAGGVAVLDGGPLGDGLLTGFERLPVKPDAETELCDGWCYFQGFGGYPRLGLNSVFVADMNGDETLDIVTGQYRTYGGEGSLAVFFGSKTDGFPESISYDLTGHSLGGEVDANIGVATAVADVSGDGAPELLVYAAGNQDFGNVGRPFLVPGAAAIGTDAALNEGSATLLDQSLGLQFPGKRSGAALGVRLGSLGDIDGDGYAEIGTSTMQPTSEGGGNSGAVLIYRGTAEGCESEPASVVAGFLGSSGWQSFGAGIQNGDFNGDGATDWSAHNTGKAHPQYVIDNPEFLWPPTCVEKLQGTSGGVSTFVFRGGLEAIPSSGNYQPSFVYFSDVQTSSTAMLDTDGDGYADLVRGSVLVKDETGSYAGQVEWIRGRPFPSEQIGVACEPEHAVLGAGNNVAGIGYDMTAMGDLNGDGCEEFAMIVNAANWSKVRNVYVLYGWGPLCDYSELRYTALTGYQFVQNALTTLAGGDMDGDGKMDLAVSNASFQKGGDSYGAIWLISGERLSTLPTHPYVEGQPPTELHLFVDPNAPGLYMLTGSTPGGLFGASLAMVPELGGSGRSALLIGSPVAESGGKVNTGGAFVYRYSMSDGGFDPIPMARVMGETYRPGSELGGSVLGVLQGSEGVVLLGSAYGTPFDQDDVIDNGSIYAAPLIAEP